MRWRPIAELDQLQDWDLLLCVNADRRDRSGQIEPLVLEGYCAKVLRETLALEPSMPRHLQFGFTHFITQDELLAACPLPKDAS